MTTLCWAAGRCWGLRQPQCRVLCDCGLVRADKVRRTQEIAPLLGACCAAEGSAFFPSLSTFTAIQVYGSSPPAGTGAPNASPAAQPAPPRSPQALPAAAAAREAENRSRAACSAQGGLAALAAARRRRRSRRRRAAPGMGQQPSKDSKEAARLAEIFAEKERARQMLDTLRELAVEEDVARLPAGPGRHRARYEAAFDYLNQLANEAHAIHVHLSERCACTAWACLARRLVSSVGMALGAVDRHTSPTCNMLPVPCFHHHSLAPTPPPGSCSAPSLAAVSRREGSSLPMPDPTPPLVLPPLPEPARENGACWLQLADFRCRLQLAACTCSSASG